MLNQSAPSKTTTNQLILNLCKSQRLTISHNISTIHLQVSLHSVPAQSKFIPCSIQMCYRSSNFSNVLHTHAVGQEDAPTKRTLGHHRTVPLQRFRNSNLILSRHTEEVLGAFLKPCHLVVKGDTIHTANLGPNCALGVTALDDVGSDVSATIILGRLPVDNDGVCSDVRCFQGAFRSCGDIWEDIYNKFCNDLM